MTALMDIIAALGINGTLAIQFCIFLMTFLFLRFFVFKPYYKAQLERQNRTSGSQEKAEQILEQTRELEVLYQRKARELNSDIKEIYDRAKLEANLEHEKISAEAREKAKAAIDKARDVIQGEFNRAREELMKQAPTIGEVISEKLLPKKGANL